MDRPILFSTQMIRALLDGRKTQTRRVFTPPKPFDVGDDVSVELATGSIRPQFAAGDRLWVREAHYITDDGDSEQAVCAADAAEVAQHLATIAGLTASHPQIDWSRHARLRPGIHMPRWASRLTLIVTEVRVQRLHEITEADCLAEGPTVYGYVERLGPRLDGIMVETEHAHVKATPRAWYRELWDKLNKARGYGWDANPWVCVVTFSVAKQNIDVAKGSL